jgi:hypothetical protein
MPFGDTSTTATPPLPQPNPAPRLWLGGLLQSRVCLVPTLRGWALMLGAALVLIFVVGRQLCAFLTVNDSIPGGVLVVEGWVPAYAAQEALAEFQSHPYLGIYVTGEPMEDGNPYFVFKNYAEFTAEKLREAGAPADRVHPVPAPLVGKDRTYTMALGLKKRLESDGVSTAKINIVSFGPHSRRTRLLYELAFGPSSQIGMIAITDREFHPDQWWKTSVGVRSVIGEAIAYGYARFIFRPSAN